MCVCVHAREGVEPAALGLQANFHLSYGKLAHVILQKKKYLYTINGEGYV